MPKSNKIAITLPFTLFLDIIRQYTSFVLGVNFCLLCT